MKPNTIDIKQISELTGAEVSSDFLDIIIECASSLYSKQSNAVSFYNGSFEHLNHFKATTVAACFVKKEHLNTLPSGVIALIVPDPYLAITKTLQMMYGSGEQYPQFFLDIASLKKTDAKYTNISERANISHDAIIGNNVTIMAGTYIGCGVTIGDGTIIHANTSLEKCKLGTNCIIRSGARIGSCGFGFLPDLKTGRSIPIPQISQVILGNDVDIGVNSCIDRGFLSDTQIGDYTKIDNLVHVGHGSVIGKSCFLAGGSTIAGSCIIGNFCMIGGHSAIANNISLPDFTKILGMSAIIKSPTEKGRTLAGIPAVDHIIWKRINIYLVNIIKKQMKQD